MKKIITSAVLVLLLGSCSKEKGCFQVAYNAYIQEEKICDIKKSELENNASANNGFVFRASEARFCWKITFSNGQDGYRKNLPESVVKHFFSGNGVSYSRVSCSTFCSWKVLIRQRSKITGLYNPTLTRQEFFLGAAADTCSTLFKGREVVLRETADSLITVIYQEENS